MAPPRVPMRENRFKRDIAAGRQQIGLWHSLCSNLAAEGLANAGYDWILVDMEHSPNEVPMVLSQLQALAGGTAAGIVRPPWNDAVMFKRLLDAGAQTLLVPYVQSADEARAAVAATRYPPEGVRGVSALHRGNDFGRIQDYFQRVHDELCLLVQVETREALDRLEEIAAVDGVDGVFIGPSDLAAGLGHLGNPAHPDVQAAIADALARCQAAGKPAGILAPVEEDARRYLEAGYTFVAVGVDLGLLIRQAEALLGRMRAHVAH